MLENSLSAIFMQYKFLILSIKSWKLNRGLTMHNFIRGWKKSIIVTIFYKCSRKLQRPKTV